MNKQVMILGAGGHAKVIADIVRINGDVVRGFLDDDPSRHGQEFFDSLICGTCEDYRYFAEDCLFILAIGDNETRKRIADNMDCGWYTAVHPSAVLGSGACVEEGSCVMAKAVIHPDVNIGRHTIINTGAIIEHDCKIGSFTHVSPRGVVCGATRIGDFVWLGAGSTVVNGISVCDGVTVGAGAAVVQSIEEAGTYVGVPARKIK